MTKLPRYNAKLQKTPDGALLKVEDLRKYLEHLCLNTTSLDAYEVYSDILVNELGGFK